MARCRGAYVKPVVKLAVGKNVHVQFTGVVHLRAPVNSYFATVRIKALSSVATSQDPEA